MILDSEERVCEGKRRSVLRRPRVAEKKIAVGSTGQWISTLMGGDGRHGGLSNAVNTLFDIDSSIGLSLFTNCLYWM
jgi:hypothetical protein